MHVCAHQRMYVHAFVLIIRLYWPLRWQRLFWTINTEQIKILFKSLPRKLAWRERRHAHSTTSVFSPQPCFLFTSVSTTPAHVSPHLLPQHLCAMVIHRSCKWWREVAFFPDRRRCPSVDTQELYQHCTFCAVLILCLLITNRLINGSPLTKEPDSSHALMSLSVMINTESCGGETWEEERREAVNRGHAWS